MLLTQRGRDRSREGARAPPFDVNGDTGKRKAGELNEEYQEAAAHMVAAGMSASVSEAGAGRGQQIEDNHQLDRRSAT